MTQGQILDILQAVKDPEIPVISLVELGCILEATERPDGTVYVEMIPTFAGCPALHYMHAQVEEALKAAGVPKFEVKMNYTHPWSSNRISEKGRKLLLDFGLSPPPDYSGDLENGVLEHAVCPKCGSRNTELKSPFGPTLCRAVHYCKDCLETFQQFKPV